jgi:hypothetical protein
METNTTINPALMTPSEKREWALSVARRMMANKRQIQAETLAHYKEHPEELAEIKAELKRLETNQLVENQ